MVHFDRPYHPDQFNTVYQTIMEENSPNKLSIVPSKEENNSNSSSNGNSNIIEKQISPRSPRTPVSARSTSPASGNPITKPKGKARIVHADKMYNLLMNLDCNQQQPANINKHGGIPEDWLTSLRPSSKCQVLPEIQVNRQKVKKKKTKQNETFNVSFSLIFTLFSITSQ